MSLLESEAITKISELAASCVEQWKNKLQWFYLIDDGVLKIIFILFTTSLFYDFKFKEIYF